MSDTCGRANSISIRIRVDVEIFESGKKTLRIQKYPDMCGAGLILINRGYAEKYFCTLKEKFCTSKRPCNVLFILKNTNEISSHFSLFPFFFLKERSDLSHVAIAKVMFSRVRSKAYLRYLIVSEAYNILPIFADYFSI